METNVWHNVTDELPDPFEPVLLWFPIYGKYNAGYWRGTGNRYNPIEWIVGDMQIVHGGNGLQMPTRWARI